MSFLRRLLNVGRDERLARDIDREMAFHVRERVEELRAAGHGEREAIYMARRQFGNRTVQGEATRDVDIVGWLDSFRVDVRYALRALRRSPAFATVAVASLALGIGANTAIYSLIDAVVIRPLPVSNPEQLVQINRGGEDQSGYFTNPLWEEIRDRTSGFSALAAVSQTSFNIADGGEVRMVNGEWVSGDYFRLFGIQPLLGRLPTRADDVRGCPPTAVLAHGFWQSEYGGRADVIGQPVSLSGTPATITGVTAPGFNSPEVGRSVQLYVPLCAHGATPNGNATLDGRSTWWLRIVGRLAPDVPPGEARAHLETIAPAVHAATVPPRFPSESQREYLASSLGIMSAERGMSGIRTQYGGALKVMMGAVALLLLIASANVANLLLARAAAREREIAIRLAIGAARRRLVRQLVTESAVLAFFGALGGLAIAYWGTGALVALISSESNPVTLDLSLSLRVLGFTALVAAITATLFGLVPAWRGTRIAPHTAMKAAGRGVAGVGGHGRFTIGKTLVVAQVALSLTLLVGAALLVGSLRNLTTLDPGFDMQGVLIVDANFRRTEIAPAERGPLYARVLERVRSLPGVAAASTTDLTPVGGSAWNGLIYVDGFEAPDEGDRLVWFNEVGDGYFHTLGIPLLAGRDFDATDAPAGTRTAIINESVARRFFGAASPVGKQLRTKAGDEFEDPYTVVGVVGDAKYRSLREEESGTVYLPKSQGTVAPSLTLLVRSANDPAALAPALRTIFSDVHRNVALQFRALDAQVAASLRRERMLALLSATFGGVALALSMLGLYGVMAYSVARRRNEIGVRIALGADNARVLRMILGDVARIVTVGLVLGAAGALGSGKLVASFLYGLTPLEPAVLGGSAALLAFIALAAGLIPAWRASRMDPVAALREE